MTDNKLHIERIVREVVQRLRAAQPSGRSPDHAPPKPEPPEGPPASLPAMSEIRQQVISLAVLEGHPMSNHCIGIPQGAVLTPSARDELRRRGTRVQYLPPVDNSQELETVLATWQTGHCPRSLLEALQADGFRIKRLEDRHSLPSVVRALTESGPHIKRLGMLLTDQPALAMCLANRPPAIRPVCGFDQGSVAEALRSIAANLLIVQPKRHSLPTMVAMARAFLRDGGGPCPEAVKQGMALGGHGQTVDQR